jgi:hypothetical protein
MTEKLEKMRKDSGNSARVIDAGIIVLFVLQTAAAGTAFVLGLIPGLSVKPWMVSLAAGVAAGCSVLYHGAKLRQRANWFFYGRNLANFFLWRIAFEMPFPIT